MNSPATGAASFEGIAIVGWGRAVGYSAWNASLLLSLPSHTAPHQRVRHLCTSVLLPNVAILTAGLRSAGEQDECSGRLHIRSCTLLGAEILFDSNTKYQRKR